MSTVNMKSPALPIQPWQITDMPLHKLLSAARAVDRSACARSARVAVLGDAATQHYTGALAAALKLRGCWPEVYEAEFDMIQHEVLDESSALYSHRPQFVVLFHSVQALAGRFYAAPDKATFADDYVAGLLQLWEALASRIECTILQHNFALPLDRPYGNQTSTSAGAFGGAVSRINARLNDVAPSRGVRLIDTEFQSAYFGKRHWFDERLWCQARQALSPTFLPPLAKSVSDTLLAELGVSVKCVVLDLDNTLWGGILGDDGLEGIEIGHTEMGLAFHRFQRSLVELKNRGLLLAVCSKNQNDSVLTVLRDHPDMVLHEDDFVAVVANYEDKASNLIGLQKTLNLGFDSFVFLDDSPYERDLVRQAFPDIQVPDLPDDAANFTADLARWNLFESKPATAEDLERLSYYQKDIERSAIRGKYSGLNDFLADLAMQAEVLPFNPFTLSRVLQLVQRSNQFNLTTIRYNEAALKAFAADPLHRCFCLRLVDRLGDNGIIAVVILRREASDLVADAWIMSCRVLGRQVEELTVNIMVEQARAMGCRRVLGRYIPTAKNGLVRDLYPRLGFTEAGTDGEAAVYALDTDSYKPKATLINCLEKAEERAYS
jgi:FkbH-like protein